MASADFSGAFPHRCRCGSRVLQTAPETSQGKPCILPSVPRIYLRTCPNNYWAAPSIAGLPHCAGLLSGSCSSSPSFAISFLQIPPHDGHPCLG